MGKFLFKKKFVGFRTIHAEHIKFKRMENSKVFKSERVSVRKMREEKEFKIKTYRKEKRSVKEMLMDLHNSENDLIFVP